ncbi:MULTISPECIES: DUF433 domain-containing protein [Spirulina sp. CCY15215]|uniref:DUF433 domain-containing protein n=1 Tax=Spirulina sp. CCY15215 TaxID=2767591 RepID=UPI0019507C15|nr:DUF433 domain-containing protein [Spirulina major]
MSLVEDKTTGIIRTERGLTIAGTRITLYQILDYIHADYPRESIRSLFRVTDEQFAAAMLYIESHRKLLETEYKIVLRQAEEVRKYWEAKNREHFEKIAKSKPKSEYRAIWKKLQERKEQREKLN